MRDSTQRTIKKTLEDLQRISWDIRRAAAREVQDAAGALEPPSMADNLYSIRRGLEWIAADLEDLLDEEAEGML